MKVKPSTTIKQMCGCGKIYVHIEHDDDFDITAVRVSLGSNDKRTCTDVISKSISNFINREIKDDTFNINKVIRDLDNQECYYKVANDKGGTTRSCADAIAQSLKEFENEHMKKKVKKK